MNSSLDLKNIAGKIRSGAQPLRKHLPLIAILGIAFYLILGVFQVNQILQQPSDQGYQLEQQKDAVKTRFDATTIEQVEKLKSRQESSNLDLPSGIRIDPFKE